jgi:phosphate transporter
MHDVVEQAAPFTIAAKDRLNHAIDTLVQLYARCVTRGDTGTAKRQLKMNQREHIAWERDTVWRQMIGQARRGEDSGTVRALGGTLLLEPEKGLLDVATPVGHVKVTRKQIYLLISVVTFIVLLNVRVLEQEAANRCFAVLIFATLMWATEAIPLFVTSIFIPLLLVTLRVVRDSEGERLSTPDATK